MWIALHLPRLSLETFAATLLVDGLGRAASVAAEAPIALMDGQRITVVNDAAEAFGVQPRMRRATALTLAPQILLGQADPKRDAEALVAVAHVALACTPQVVVPVPADDPTVSPHGVLLEVRASLRYFGGLERLLQHLLGALAPLGHRIHVASAPTPQGALLLARAHEIWHAADLTAAQTALDKVPVWLLGPGREHWDALQGMGLRMLSDLRCLPRSGVARRFGQGLLDELDAAYGLRPNPRTPIVAPPAFESRLELHARADTTDQLLHGARILLARLVAWLAAQHASVRRYTLVMAHEQRWRRDDVAATELEIALAEPSRDAAHLAGLLSERLAPLQLPAPTLELRLRAADIVRRAPPNGELFPTPRSEREGLTRLIERLQARLGREQICCMAALHDHRPERAGELRAAEPGVPGWGARRARTSGTAGTTGKTGGGPVHPVWLLDPPEPLAERASRPLLDGRPLLMLAGPERIEAGWWDAGLAERDYFIARASSGALVWIYRARLPLSAEGSGWYLQGRYG
ncbi:MAG: DNA polymerase Y family protein [Proteobacteria bacterium]|nr:DNA polymerase Y family protein [Pseudomonadota bacterium]